MRRQPMVIAIVVVLLILPGNAYGMHISEGFIAPRWCLLWYAVTLPFLGWGVYRMKKQTEANPRIKLLLGVAGAFTFFLSALKLPSVTGSCSHMTGTGLGAILFGPAVMSVLGLVVLLFQALLLAHGGITTLGANTFSMGIAGPLLAWSIYAMLSSTKLNRTAVVFTATFAGSLFTYGITALQLALAFPGTNGSVWASFVRFIALFGVTQLPLAVVEGLLSAMVFRFIRTHNYDELVALHVYRRDEP